MSDDSAAERFREYFKYLSTVDGVCVLGTVSLGNFLKLDLWDLGFPLFLFSTSACVSIYGFYLVTMKPQSAEGPLVQDLLSRLAMWFTVFGIIGLIGTTIEFSYRDYYNNSEIIVDPAPQDQ